MSILILLAALSATPKTPALPTPVAVSTSDVKASADIGLYSVKTGQITAEALKANFKKHLKLQNAEHQKSGGSLSAPWKDFGKLNDEITWKTLVQQRPEWKFTDTDNIAWIYQAPGFGSEWPTKVLQIVDKSSSSSYEVEVTAYCSGSETECAPYLKESQALLAPRPLSTSGDMAFKQWGNRVQTESCTVLARNMSHPRYPTQALRDGIGGTVRIGFRYNRCGNVRDAWVETSSGNRDLDRAALTQALKWQIDTTTLPEGKNTGMAVAPVTFKPE